MADYVLAAEGPLGLVAEENAFVNALSAMEENIMAIPISTAPPPLAGQIWPTGTG